MTVCSVCGDDWSSCGREYHREASDRIDYFCLKCHTKRKPVESVDDLEQEQTGRKCLVIPDLHFPFVKHGYLEFLKQTYEKYSCDTVIQIGDMVDFHAMSRHTTDPDGMSAREELEAAIEYAKQLAVAYPRMKVCFGNHDRIPNRQAYDMGLSSSWIKTLKDVLIENGVMCHGWDFDTEHVIDGVKYIHGEGRKAKQRAVQDGISIVQGHYHTEAYIHWHVNDFQRVFAVQLGGLISDKSYAAAYAKHFPKSFKCCGVVIDGTPLIEMWRL